MNRDTYIQNIQNLSQKKTYIWTHARTHVYTFSDKYFARTDPEATAIPVAMACPEIAPAATPRGFKAELRAMVARKDLSVLYGMHVHA